MAESKPGLGERIKSMSLQSLLGAAAVVLVVGLVVGLAAGFKIEQQRTKDDVKKAKAQAAAKTGNTGAQPGAATSVRLVGKVGTTSANTVTINVTGTTASTERVVTSATTTVVKAAPGTPSDVTAGSRVVWRPKPGVISQAEEIIVLPASAKLGSSVVNATADSMTFKSNGKNVTVSTQGATVEKVTTAKVADIASGDKVVAQARRTNPTTLAATEVIVLPTSSKFVA